MSKEVCKLCGKSYKDYQGRSRTRCGSCNTKIRRYRAKAAAVKLLGGKCERCGWQGDQAALQFHHKDPGKKDFILGSAANKSWDSIVGEIKKCMLLCANCHSIEHSSKFGKEFLQEVSNYKGRTLSI